VENLPAINPVKPDHQSEAARATGTDGQAVVTDTMFHDPVKACALKCEHYPYARADDGGQPATVGHATGTVQPTEIEGVIDSGGQAETTVDNRGDNCPTRIRT
jgi:hypothetical protein